MASTCFGLRPSSGSLQLSLAKVVLILKHSVRLCRNLLWGGVTACPSMAYVLCAVQSTAHNTHNTHFNVNCIRVLINVNLLVNELCEYQKARCNDKNCFVHLFMRNNSPELRNLMFLVVRSSYCFDRLLFPRHYTLQPNTVLYICL